MIPDGFAQPISAGGLIRRNRRQNDLPQALARAANGDRAVLRFRRLYIGVPFMLIPLPRKRRIWRFAARPWTQTRRLSCLLSRDQQIRGKPPITLPKVRPSCSP